MRGCQRVHLFSKKWPHLVIPFFGRWGSSIEKKFIVFMLFGMFCMCGCGYFVSIVKQKEKKLFKLWSCHSSLSPCKESMAFIDFVDFAVVILTRKLVFHVSQIPITFQATNEILLKVFMLSAQDKKICIIVLQDLCQWRWAESAC